MQRSRRSAVRLRAALCVVIALGVVSCSSDDDDLSVDPDASDSESEDASGAGTDDELVVQGSVRDDLLLVPRAYLQGEWCADDGGNWTVDGDTATLTEESGAIAEFPVDILFIAAPGTELVSQTDDQFTIGSEIEQITFTRGSC